MQLRVEVLSALVKLIISQNRKYIATRDHCIHSCWLCDACGIVLWPESFTSYHKKSGNVTSDAAMDILL